MPSEWRINYWPPCTHHVFLSHCQEDRQGLIVPVFEELERRGFLPWIDRHHYPTARDALQALREGLLECRHVVYFLTPAALHNGRGWMAIERSFADAIQRRMVYGDEISHFELPLLLVPLDDPAFQRSIWRALADKCKPIGVEYPAPATGRLAKVLRSFGRTAENFAWAEEHVNACADAIEDFVAQEEQWRLGIATRITQDPQLQLHFADINLQQRILALSPQRIIVP